MLPDVIISDHGDKKETGEKGREMISKSLWCAWNRQKKSQEETLIFSRVKRLISEKGWFYSTEQVFFTNGPE